jgi:hypothetical protein
MLVLVFAVGCADAMNTTPGPDLGQGHGDGSTADGGVDTIGTNVPMCTAAVETLSGRAAYVQGSSAATDPGAMPYGQPAGTCAEWVPAHAADYNNSLGQLEMNALVAAGATLASAVHTSAGCAYTVRLSQDPSAGSTTAACAVTLDYVLTVP